MVSNDTPGIIEQLMDEHKALTSLLPTSEVSLRVNADVAFSKTLLLSVASYFESRLSEEVLNTFREELGQLNVLTEFVRNRAVERRYHEWFDWRANNANQFFGSFGREFRAYMEERIRATAGLQQSVQAFLELGNLRNNLVHRNFAVFPLDKTVEEIFDLYKSALSFVETFPMELRSFLQSSRV